MKFKQQIALALLLFVSACTSISIMWLVWTGIFYVMEMMK